MIEKNILGNTDAQNCFKYLKQLAEIVSIANEGERSFLYKQYKKMTRVSSYSVLARYLNPDEPNNKPLLGHMPIFPFGFNLSQKAAAENALSEQISVIEGPPGTGKTQTILNIIANAFINEKTVAVVSNNNAATANILEKLEQYGVGFIAAYLGSKENKEKFIENQITAYPDMADWEMDSKDYYDLNKELEASGFDLEKMLKVKNKIATLRQELSALAVEKEYFNTYQSEAIEEVVSYRSLYKHDSKVIMALWLEFQHMIEKESAITLKYKINNLLRYGIFSFSFYYSTFAGRK